MKKNKDEIIIRFLGGKIYLAQDLNATKWDCRGIVLNSPKFTKNLPVLTHNSLFPGIG